MEFKKVINMNIKRIFRIIYRIIKFCYFIIALNLFCFFKIKDFMNIKYNWKITKYENLIYFRRINKDRED